MKLNVLVLHNLADFSTTLRSAVDYIMCYERYGGSHNFIYQRITDPHTPALRSIEFHLIIIDATALGICRYRPRELWYAEKERWRFIGESDAVKFAFPQDDYHNSNVLDELFDDWNIDQVYTVLPQHNDIVYPRMTKKRKPIEVVLTGYVDDDSISLVESFATPFRQRPVDVSQRVTMYSPVGGRHAQIKGLLAEKVRQHAVAAGMTIDISTSDAHKVYGDNWLRFLGRSKFVPSCEGGVSIFDPDGLIQDRVSAALAKKPDASFEEIESACFPGLDGKYVFSAISPRLFEAAMLGCSQVLVKAPYLGELQPHDHYIPVQPDLSDVKEAVDAMRDDDAAERRAAATYETLIATDKYRFSTFARRVLANAENFVALRHIAGSSDAEFKSLAARHDVELQRLKAQRDVIPPLPLRVVRRAFALVKKIYGAGLSNAGRRTLAA